MFTLFQKRRARHLRSQMKYFSSRGYRFDVAKAFMKQYSGRYKLK